MSDQPQPRVISVNMGPGGIPKRPIEVADVTPDGIVGDAHDHDKHNTPLQALCLIDVEDIDDLRSEGFDVSPGATGENITCRDLQIDELEVGSRLTFSGGLEVELTKRRKPCYVLDAIDPTLKEAAVGRIGYYARIIRPAPLRAGESICVEC